MGKSFTSFRDQGFWCRDGLLEAWLRCLALHLPDESYLADNLLHKLREQWMFASSGLCNGWVAAALDEHLTDPEKIASVVAASDRAISRLNAFSPVVPAAFLNALGIVGTSFVDHPIEWFLDIHNTFNALLKGQLDMDAASSRVLPLQDQSSIAAGSA